MVRFVCIFLVSQKHQNIANFVLILISRKGSTSRGCHSCATGHLWGRVSWSGCKLKFGKLGQIYLVILIFLWKPLHPRQEDGEDAGASSQTLVGVGNLVATIFKGIADLPLTTINAVLKPFATPAPAKKAAATVGATPAETKVQVAAAPQPQVAAVAAPQYVQLPGLGQPLPAFTFPPVTVPPTQPTQPTDGDSEASTTDPEDEDEDKESEVATEPATEKVTEPVTIETTTAAANPEEDGDDEADDRVEVSL